MNGDWVMTGEPEQRPTSSIQNADTRAPFQSVKDAVSLFGEDAFSGEKPAIKKTKAHSAERMLANETQLHLAQKELYKLKEQLKNVETTKAQALVELEKSKAILEDLSNKVKALNESKEFAIKATKAAKCQAKQLEEANCGNLAGTDGAWKQDLESARAQYMSVITELNSAKQELQKIRQDCDASLEAKAAAIKQVAEAEDAAKANAEQERRQQRGSRPREGRLLQGQDVGRRIPANRRHDGRASGGVGVQGSVFRHGGGCSEA
ncbi:WEB family protein At5g55860-like [Malus sylvestris]|uniref:WEB family protein At5g55860-like n=1 Tax=Malus sylvestris TaxID=3752 RepID=UPI0021ACF9AF|nr:WEB family protein At5g55860-like [Malus sylvestris]